MQLAQLGAVGACPLLVLVLDLRITFGLESEDYEILDLGALSTYYRLYRHCYTSYTSFYRRIKQGSVVHVVAWLLST